MRGAAAVSPIDVKVLAGRGSPFRSLGDPIPKWIAQIGSRAHGGA